MRLSITEEKPNYESREQMLSFFEKEDREPQLPPGQPQPAPQAQAVPVASIQINIYNIPRSENGGPDKTRKPTITIKPGWTYWTTQSANEQSTSPSQEPIAVNQQNDASLLTTQKASTTTTPTTPNNTIALEDSTQPTNETDSLEYDDDDYPSVYSFVGNGDLSFLGNVVESTNADYDEILFDMVPIVNTSSNMRG